MDDRRRAYEFIHLGISLAFELRNVSLPLLNRRSQASSHVSADVSDCVQPGHFISDRGLPSQKTSLMISQALGINRKSLGEAGDFGGQLLVHLRMQAEKFRVRGPRWGCGQ